MHPVLVHFRQLAPAHELAVADLIWADKDRFLAWPDSAVLFHPGAKRNVSFHTYTPSQLAQIKAAGVRKDTRSNGPAVMAYLLAKGRRPSRTVSTRGWNIHHVYDGKYPAQGKTTTCHAVKDGNLFTQSAGLVAAHPVADALADELPYFAWLLRHEAFTRFKFNPDGAL